MKWTAEAEDAIKKVPFFVHKRVRARVEKETAAAGSLMNLLQSSGAIPRAKKVRGGFKDCCDCLFSQYGSGGKCFIYTAS